MTTPSLFYFRIFSEKAPSGFFFSLNQFLSFVRHAALLKEVGSILEKE
jgi:hypothetical protein